MNVVDEKAGKRRGQQDRLSLTKMQTSQGLKTYANTHPPGNKQTDSLGLPLKGPPNLIQLFITHQIQHKHQHQHQHRFRHQKMKMGSTNYMQNLRPTRMKRKITLIMGHGSTAPIISNVDSKVNFPKKNLSMSLTMTHKMLGRVTPMEILSIML